LTDAELDRIRDIVRKEEHEAGERVIEENVEATKLYLVLKGRASIKKRGDFGRREMVIDDAIPGEIFGWSAIAEPHTYTADVIATEKSTFLTIDSKALISLFENNKDIGYKVVAEIASVISSRFRKVIGQFVSYI
jgi:CRP-like cAMP-binding protein